MTPSKKRLLNCVYAMAFAALVANVSVTSLNIIVLARNNEWVNHTREVMIAIERTASILRDAENGQRGYLITGDESYLGPYRTSIADTSKNLTLLAALTSDNPAQQIRIGRLRRVIGTRLSLIKETVDLWDLGAHEDAMDLVRSGLGKEAMSEARSLVGVMQEEEDRLLRLRLEASRTALVTTIVTFSIATCISLLMLILVGYVHRLEVSSHIESVIATRRLAAIVESSHDAIVGKTLEGIITTWNASAERIFGYAANEVIGKSISLLVPLDRRDEEPKILARVQQGERVDHFVTVRITKGGRPIDVSLTISPIRDDTGQIVGASKIARDISQEKAAKETLEKQTRLTQSVLKSMAEAVFVADTQERIILVNPAAERMYMDVKDIGIVDWPKYFGLYLPDMSTPFPANELPLVRAIRGEEVDGVEIFSRSPKTPDGLWALVSGRPMKDAAGAICSGIVVCRDITERKHAEQALARQAQDLARSNEELERFAYVASHDLQEPLRMVGSFTQLLARRYRGQIDESADEFIAYIVGGVTRMQELINDLLAYSRVGNASAMPREIDCETVFEQTLSNLKKAIDETGAVVTHDPLPSLRTDPTRLGQVLQNLIGNAIKFRGEDASRIHISARREGEEWVFSVRDNGIGFDPKHLQRIFVIFQRLHGKEEYPGTGIGLAICKKIVERDGGRIWAESARGRGACFYFSIPANPIRVETNK